MNKSKHDILKSKYKEIFNSDAGKIVLEDLTKRYHINSTTFLTDTNEMLLKEGHRQVMLYLLKMID